MILDHFYGGTVTSTDELEPRPAGAPHRPRRPGPDPLHHRRRHADLGRRLPARAPAVRIQSPGRRRPVPALHRRLVRRPWRKWDRTMTSNGIRAKPVVTKAGSGAHAPGEPRPRRRHPLLPGRHHRHPLGRARSAPSTRWTPRRWSARSIAREMSPSWGDSGGGGGMNALRAQAVAARSYVIARRRPVGRARDHLRQHDLPGVPGLRHPPALRARACHQGGGRPAPTRRPTETTKQIRRFLDGRVARTEFSSSSGGYTAGGDFPAVPDDGDDTSINPNHDWSVTVDREALEDVYSFVVGRDLGDVQLGRGVVPQRARLLRWPGVDGQGRLRRGRHHR